MSGVRDELCGEPALRGEAGLPPRLPGAVTMSTSSLTTGPPGVTTSR